MTKSENGRTAQSRQSEVRTAAKQPRGKALYDESHTFSLAKQVAVALHELLGPMCEVVIHDFSDLEHSIVHLEGDITNRAKGGAATDLLLERVRRADTDRDLYAYATSLPGGRRMKSSTIFIRGANGQAVGALCVNLDVTHFIAFRNSLNALVTTKDSDAERTTEMLSDNIFETVQNAVAEVLYDAGLSLHALARDEKIELVKQLESRGMFQVKKAVPIVADMLGLSRATVYNYLREGRGIGREA